MTEAIAKEKKKKKKPGRPPAENKLLTDNINQEDVEMHKLIKKRNPSYPSLPKFILNTRHKMKIYKDKGLQESVLRGFHKRVSNWHETNELVFVSTEGE